MITLQEENYEHCIDDLMLYLDAHGDEVEQYAIEPMLDVYYDAGKEGTLRIFTMRADEELVGYSAFWIGEHPHHAGKIFAVNDLVYIRPDWRGSWARGFFEYCDEQLSDADSINYSFKTQHDHPELMESLGYEHTEKVYTKVRT